MLTNNTCLLVFAVMIGALIERPLTPADRQAWTDGRNNAIGTLVS